MRCTYNEIDISYQPPLIEIYGYLGVAFYSGYWRNCDYFYMFIYLLPRTCRKRPQVDFDPQCFCSIVHICPVLVLHSVLQMKSA